MPSHGRRDLVDLHPPSRAGSVQPVSLPPVRTGSRPGSARLRLRRWTVVWAALAYVAVGTVALWPSIRPGRTLVAADILAIDPPYANIPRRPPIHNILLSDVPFQFFPWLTFAGQALRHGHVPQWNPTLLGGIPVTPNGFVNVYYPPTWVTAVLAPMDAYNVYVLLHLVIGALGIFVFARKLGARPMAAWVGGLLTFCASFWIHWSTHLVHLAGMVWMPWALVATTAVIERPTRRRVVALAAVFGVWWLGANPQYAYYGSIAMAGYAAVLLVGRRIRDGGTLVRPALAFAAGVGLGALLAMPVLLPTATRASQIERDPEALSTGHMPKQQAIRTLVPDAYGSAKDDVYFHSDQELMMDSPFLGVTAVLLIAAAAGTGGGGTARRVVMLGLAGVIVIAFFGFPHRVFFAALPGYNRFRVNARWLSLLPSFALPLAAVGLDGLLARHRRARIGLLAGGVASAAAVSAWFLIVRTQAGAPERFFFRRGVLAVGIAALVVGAGLLLGRPGWRKIGLVALIAVVGVEIGFNTTRWYPSVAEKGAFPEVAVADIATQRGGRLVHVGAQTIFAPFAPNLPMLTNAADSQGFSVLFPKDYARLLRIIDDFGAYAKLYNAAPPLSKAAALSSPLLDVLDVRTIVVDDGVAVPPTYQLLDDGNPQVYARASLGPAEVVPSAGPVTDDEMWRRVADPAWDPKATAAVVGLDHTVAGAPGTVSEPPSDGPDHERWDVDAPGGGFLRVSGSWDEGWSARLDGRSVRVLRADGVFRGVVLPAGRHRVEFSFRNTDEARGRLLAYAALAVLIGLCVPVSVPAFRRRARRAA